MAQDRLLVLQVMVSLLSHFSLMEWLSLLLMSRQETAGRSCARFCRNQSLRLPTLGIQWKRQATLNIQVEQCGSVPARLPQIPYYFLDASCLLPLFGSHTANSPVLMNSIYPASALRALGLLLADSAP